LLKKTVSGIMLTVLLTSMLTFAFNIQPAKSDYVWTRTIYIRADGSIWPLGAPVSAVDNVTYTLTDNIVGAIPEYSSVIIIERNNIVLDGAGYTLQGTKALVSKGIELNGRSNVTIKNMKITALHTGITLYNSSYSSISGNNITDNNWHGISLGSSSNNNSVSGNNITNNKYGIGLDYSSNNNSVSGNNITANSWTGVPLYSSFYNSVSGNNITNNGIGIVLESSSNNTISGNNITANNNEGVYLYSSSNNNSVSGNNMTNNGHGIRLDYSSNNNSVSGNNMTNNGHCVWLYSSSNNSVSGNNITNNYYGVYLNSSSNNNSVSGNNIINNGNGIRLGYSSNNSVSGNNIANNEYGVYLYYSSYNSVSGNNITANNHEGVCLDYSFYNSVSGNNIANNEYGVYLSGSSYNSIVGNNITANNWAGVRLYYSSNNNTISGNNITANNGHGVYLWDSSNNSVSGNNMTNNEYGVWLYYSFYNSVSGNNITNNEYGVYLYYSSNNKFYHNDFIDNAQQVLIATSGYANVWDDGYPSGGNYWSDYTGVDLYSGPNQDTPGSDGIGDTPHLIEAGNQDRYPLMNPYVPTYLTITVTIDGTTDPLPGTYTYVKGTVVSVTAIPGINCRFEYWILDGINVGAHNPIEVLMDSSHVLQAFFAQITHQLPITSTERGATDPSSGTYTYVNGTVANVTAIPQAGYSFDYWLLDGEVRTENPISILMDMNHTLEAFFTDNLPPEIGEPVQEPSEDVEPFQNVTITVNVTDVGTGVCNVTLWYSIDNGTTWMPFNMTGISVNTYQAMIPGRENRTWVTYKIIAYDNSGNSVVNDNHGYYYKYHVIPEFPLALILPLLMLTTLVATVLLKRKRKTKHQLP
jgi:parallel beta-helix repeat protein